MKIRAIFLTILLIFGLKAFAQFEFITNNGTITINRDVRNAITGYSGPDYSLTIPNTINGLPVTAIASGAFFYCEWMTSVTIPTNITSIGSYAFENCRILNNVTFAANATSISEGEFEYCPGLTTIVIPESVTNIGDWAFSNCGNLAIYFAGNAPIIGGLYVFANDNISTITTHYLPGTLGWDTFNANSTLNPAILWNPQAMAFIRQGGQFSFNITGPTNAIVVIEACTNLGNPFWQPLSTNILSSMGTSSFTDPQWAKFKTRFYGFGFP